MKNIYQFNANKSVVEVRTDVQKLINRGYIAEPKGIQIVKSFGEQKAKATKEQRFITVML